MAICLKTDFIFFQASKKSDLNKIVQILPFHFFFKSWAKTYNSQMWHIGSKF